MFEIAEAHQCINRKLMYLSDFLRNLEQPTPSFLILIIVANAAVQMTAAVCFNNASSCVIMCEWIICHYYKMSTAQVR